MKRIENQYQRTYWYSMLMWSDNVSGHSCQFISIYRSLFPVEDYVYVHVFTTCLSTALPANTVIWGFQNVNLRKWSFSAESGTNIKVLNWTGYNFIRGSYLLRNKKKWFAHQKNLDLLYFCIADYACVNIHVFII